MVAEGELSCRGQKSIQTVLLSNDALEPTDAARASSSKQPLVHNEPAEAILEGTGSGMCAESTFGGDSHLDSCESQGQSHALPVAAKHTTSLNVGLSQERQSVHRTERDGTHEHGCVTGLAIKRFSSSSVLVLRRERAITSRLLTNKGLSVFMLVKLGRHPACPAPWATRRHNVCLPSRRALRRN